MVAHLALSVSIHQRTWDPDSHLPWGFFVFELLCFKWLKGIIGVLVLVLQNLFVLFSALYGCPSWAEPFIGWLVCCLHELFTIYYHTLVVLLFHDEWRADRHACSYAWQFSDPVDGLVKSLLLERWFPFFHWGECFLLLHSVWLNLRFYI